MDYPTSQVQQPLASSEPSIQYPAWSGALPAKHPNEGLANNSAQTEKQLYCRKYIWGICDRLPTECKFKHVRDTYYMKKVLRFCHDYQNNVCRRRNCLYLHTTKEEEMIFFTTGNLPQCLIDRYVKLESKLMATTLSSIQESFPQAMLQKQVSQQTPGLDSLNKPGFSHSLIQYSEKRQTNSDKPTPAIMHEQVETDQQLHEQNSPQSTLEDPIARHKVEDANPAQNSRIQNSVQVSMKQPLLNNQGLISPHVPCRQSSGQPTMHCSLSSNVQSFVAPQSSYMQAFVPFSMHSPLPPQLNQIQSSSTHNMHDLIAPQIQSLISPRVPQNLADPTLYSSSPSQANHVQNIHTTHGLMVSQVQGHIPSQIPRNSEQPILQCSVLPNVNCLPVPQLPYVPKPILTSSPSQIYYVENSLPQMMNDRMTSEVQNPISQQVSQNSMQLTMQNLVSSNTQGIIPPQLPYMQVNVSSAVPPHINHVANLLSQTMHGVMTSKVQNPIPPQIHQNSMQPTMQCIELSNAQNLIPPQLPYMQKNLSPALPSHISHKVTSLPHTMHVQTSPEVQNLIPQQVPQNSIQPTMQSLVSSNTQGLIPPQLPALPTHINSLPHTMHGSMRSEILNPIPPQIPQNSMQPTIQNLQSSNVQNLIPPQKSYMQINVQPALPSHVNHLSNSLPYGLMPAEVKIPTPPQIPQNSMQYSITSQVQGLYHMPTQLPHMQNSLQLTGPDSISSVVHSATVPQFSHVSNIVPPIMHSLPSQVQNFTLQQMSHLQNWDQPTMQGLTSSQIQGVAQSQIQDLESRIHNDHLQLNPQILSAQMHPPLQNQMQSQIAPHFNRSIPPHFHDALAFQTQSLMPPHNSALKPSHIQNITPRASRDLIPNNISDPFNKQTPASWQLSMVPLIQSQEQSQVLDPMLSEMQGNMSTQVQGFTAVTPVFSNAVPQQIPKAIANHNSQFPGQILPHVQWPTSQVSTQPRN